MLMSTYVSFPRQCGRGCVVPVSVRCCFARLSKKSGSVIVGASFSFYMCAILCTLFLWMRILLRACVVCAIQYGSSGLELINL